MKKVKDMKTYYFQCDCSSQQHTVGITFDIDEKEMSFEVQLSKYHGFWGRLVRAIRYVLGYQCKYGHWDTTIMNEEKFVELYNVMTRFAHTAGIRDKSAKKIQTALKDINSGKPNSMVSGRTHVLNDVTNTLKLNKK
jgi:hypothetical protein